MNPMNDMTHIKYFSNIISFILLINNMFNYIIYKFCLNTIEKLITKINDNTPDPYFAKKVIIKHPNGDKILEDL